MGDMGAPGSQEWGEVLVLKNAASGSDVQRRADMQAAAFSVKKWETGNPR